MKILMDTHIFIWAVSAPDMLTERWRMELRSRANEVYLSAVSVTEMAIKSSIGKLQLNIDPIDIA